MKISARNQFKGIVTNINEGAVNAIVSIEANGEVISSTISINAVKELGLKKGDAAYAIIKATEVMIATELPKISARNKFHGVIKGIQSGSVNDIVTLETKFGVVSSTISKNAVEELELSVGKEAYAIIKATSVMVGIE
ncbi:TOBE domain-containing protein [Lachnoanaerobaculum sp. Marseille-Q4761]|jgi:molybdenum-pterin binding domain|uniref:TOBE domain-containing protein n=1 Tax=Lachnoanaerobaculum sp. Marseille-Q4761 TaxID=2819511 RepID=UPI001AA12D1C|nr:TOBE domain-containing protein [Lachnoanaerobaculum sp. Marseille-Q4761]MBO1871069.1 TOBE domain-containing protein [Lachnoanaerobaculum sp. Marseille-Q4761]